ncbi:MAG TPA: PepSY domain-containing protein [Myxococcales bacterium LLY-WYZ-16_1]|nr:PepSY domain-containing protein [Myxococcales bacterium LLY-WYZ-16_1]
MKKKQLWGLWTILGVAACGSGSGMDPSESGLFGTAAGALNREEAEKTAASLLNGRVLASENALERGAEVYEVDVLLPSGAVVEVEIEVATGRVVELECENPQPDDDVDVGSGLLTLQQALDVALGTTDDQVVEWEIERDEDDDGWEWEFVLRTNDGSEIEVEIDAETGARERDDDDGDEPWDRDDDEEDFDDDDPDTIPEALEEKVLALVAGTIESAEIDSDDGLEEWEIEVRTPEGGLVELELLVSSHRLVEAQGIEGPFDIVFEPEGLLSLGAALQAVGIEASDLEGWELDREDDGEPTYELETADDDVEVHARTGAVVDD